MAEVTLAGLTKRYAAQGEPAVREVSLAVADGEFMVLLGPSGCGKSTILRMIAGLEPVTSGTVAIDGRVVNDVPARDRDIAMVFQSYALYPHMDVFDNLAFGLKRRRVPRGEIETRVRAAAEKLGLTPFLRRKPHALSGGQRQRVALGRAIVRQPKVFLFDEPLSNLDAALRVSTRNELIRQQQEIGVTTIYVTHDQVEAMTMGHRICIMDKGEVVQVGPPLAVYRDPATTFVARFLGNPPMNLLRSQIANEGESLAAHAGALRVPLPGWTEDALTGSRDGTVVLGIRPEDLYEVTPDGSADRWISLPAEVLAVEPLGAETLLLLAVDDLDEEVIARIGRDTRLRPHDHTTLALDLAALHLFDAQTTRAIPRAFSPR